MNRHHYFFFTTAFTRSCRARPGRALPGVRNPLDRSWSISPKNLTGALGAGGSSKGGIRYQPCRQQNGDRRRHVFPPQRESATPNDKVKFGVEPRISMPRRTNLQTIGTGKPKLSKRALIARPDWVRSAKVCNSGELSHRRKRSQDRARSKSANDGALISFTRCQTALRLSATLNRTACESVRRALP